MANQTVPISYVVNTRSKTLHNPTIKETKDVSKNGSLRSVKKTFTSSVSPPRANSVVGAEVPSGYGKAMVTPLNKRLILQRDNNRAGNEKSSICFGRKQTSTMSWKEKRDSTSPTPISSREASKPKLLRLTIINVVMSILYHLMFWKLQHIVSCLLFIEWHFVITIIAVGYLFWAATKEMSSTNEKSRGFTNCDSKCLYPKSAATNRSSSHTITPQRTSVSPRRQSVERQCYEPRNTSPHAKVKTAQMVYSQNARVLNSSTPLCNNFSRNKIPVVRNGSSIKENLSPTPAVRQPRSTSKESIIGKNYRPLCYGNSKTTFNTGCFNYSNRSFKPQLEDIKSSYLLLNQKEMQKNIKKEVNHVKNGLALHSYEFGRVTDYWLDIKIKEIIEGVSAPKPQLINEDHRQVILQETIRKYRTKKFWNDSKYEKIEGLNWISWK